MKAFEKVVICDGEATSQSSFSVADAFINSLSPGRVLDDQSEE